MNTVVIPGTDITLADNLRLSNGWTAHENHLKVAFGLDRKAKWPLEGLTARKLGNVWVEVRPYSGRGKSHRCVAQCPSCGQTVPAGRLAQHIGKSTCA